MGARRGRERKKERKKKLEPIMFLLHGRSGA
jgi:hypothetical protein